MKKINNAFYCLLFLVPGCGVKKIQKKPVSIRETKIERFEQEVKNKLDELSNFYQAAFQQLELAEQKKIQEFALMNAIRSIIVEQQKATNNTKPFTVYRKKMDKDALYLEARTNDPYLYNNPLRQRAAAMLAQINQLDNVIILIPELTMERRP